MSVTLIKLDDQGNPIDGSEVELYDFDPTTHGWYQGESITPQSRSQVSIAYCLKPMKPTRQAPSWIISSSLQ